MHGRKISRKIQECADELKKPRDNDDQYIQFNPVEFAKAILPAIKDELQRDIALKRKKQ